MTVERMLPLYEAKMIHHYDTKWATYEPDGSTRDVTPGEKRDPEFFVMSRYWVHEEELRKALPEEFRGTGFFGFRNIARSTDARTVIGTLLPVVPVGHSMPLVFSRNGRAVQAVMTSIVADYVMRQKLGGTNLTYNYVQQLPMPAPSQFARVAGRIEEHVDRLNGQQIDDQETQLLRAETDALLFHLYGVSCEDADFILETFPIVKKKDIAAYGEYRTKRLILEEYDKLKETSSAG